MPVWATGGRTTRALGAGFANGERTPSAIFATTSKWPERRIQLRARQPPLMYAVVGCGECSALWIVELGGESSQCPRCGKRRPMAKRKKFLETDDEDHAREVRASMLAARQDQDEAFAAVDSFAELDAQAEEPAVSDEEYLEGAGLDADEVAAAGERVGNDGARSRSRKETVLAAVRELDEPTDDAVAAYAADHGVDPEYASKLLGKLVRAGELSESGGTYRRL